MTREVGIFGWELFGPYAKVIRHEEAGWAVGTRGLDRCEGSVTAGTAVVGSSLLVVE